MATRKFMSIYQGRVNVYEGEIDPRYLESKAKYTPIAQAAAEVSIDYTAMVDAMVDAGGGFYGIIDSLISVALDRLDSATAKKLLALRDSLR